MILTIEQALKYASDAGFQGAGLITIVSIGLAESGLNTEAVGHNPPVASIGHETLDRGWLQFNDYWHPEVNDQCAFDPLCCAEHAFRISGGGADFTPWSTFNANAHLRYVTQVQAAFDRWRLGGQSTGSNGQERITMPEQVTREWIETVSTRLGIPSPLTGGQPPASNTYVVQSGDTLSGIAQKLTGDSRKWNDLYQRNIAVIGSNPNLIHPGTVLFVPDGW